MESNSLSSLSSSQSGSSPPPQGQAQESPRIREARIAWQEACLREEAALDEYVRLLAEEGLLQETFNRKMDIRKQLTIKRELK